VSERVPGLYVTENLPFEEKTIYRRYKIDYLGFYRLVVKLDKDGDLAFGYANLNNDLFAEWGCISVRELLDKGAMLDRSWKPTPAKNY